MNQTWTKALPTADGWYWVISQPRDRPQVVELATFQRERVAWFPGSDEPSPVDRDEFSEALWCGPLPVPAIPLEV